MSNSSINLNISGTAYAFTARVQELSRIVIPEPIRDELKLKRGDKVGGFLWKISGTSIKRGDQN